MATRTSLALALALATALAFALLTGCGAGATSSPGAQTGGSDGASPYAGPIRSSDVALGHERYDARCGSACHDSGGGPPLQGIGWTAERLRRQVREGSRDMPAIGPRRLSDDELEAVLAYLVTLGAVQSDAATAATP